MSILLVILGISALIFAHELGHFLSAKLFEKQEMARLETLSEKRKNQIKGAMRAEKIRTYNFPQDRVTDHRIKKSFHNIEGVMDGELDSIVGALNENGEV